MPEAGCGKTIISYKDLDVKLTRQADENILALLNRTVLGTKGGMRHQLLRVKEKISAYRNNIRFVSLYKRDRLTGTVGFCYRKIMTAGKYFHSSYLRYFAFMPLFQAALNSKGSTGRSRLPGNEETWKERVLAFFRKPQMLDFPGYEKGEKHVVYAYVESKNERSKNIIQQVGFEHIRTFLTVAFSRFNPRKSDEVIKLQANEVEKMKALLEKFYAGHSFYSDEFSFYNDKFYVIKEGDEIIAGLSVVPSSFRIVDIPGAWGWVLMKILPLTPYFKKVFQPEELLFLVFESIYFKEGREKSLESLMESVCAIEGYNLGLTWLDDRSELYEAVSTGIKLGALNRILDAKAAMVFANFINFSGEEKKAFFEQPAYISGFDFT
ncbi:MAG: hypothetical protein U9N72_07535 [Bacteroidota bacterium]|nr:hypothetical protein [Bacteroidota bacterium]